VADEKAAGDLGVIPPAFERRRDVILKDGSKVTIEKWSISKYGRMAVDALQEGKERDTVKQSLLPEQREKADTMSDEDVETVLTAAIEFNIDPTRVKNSLRLTKARLAMAEAMNQSGQ